MDGIGEFLKTVKAPTLTAAGLAMWFGYSLVDNSGESINTAPEGIGVALLAIGIILLALTFLDFRYKDSTDNVIDQQRKTINSLQGVVNAMSESRRLDEEVNQKTMTSATNSTEIGGDGKKGFRIEDSDSTLTS